MEPSQPPTLSYANPDLALRANWPAVGSIICALPAAIILAVLTPDFTFFRSPSVSQYCTYYGTWALCGGGPVILGLIGLFRARRLRVGGTRFALVGLLVGAMNCAVIPWVSHYLTERKWNDYAISHAWVRCAGNMKIIGGAILLYGIDHKGRFPDTLDELLTTEDIEPYSFVCPLSGLAPAPRGATTLNGATSFIYLGKGMTDKSDPKLIVLYELPQNHQGTTDDAHFLYADGHVDSLKRNSAEKIIKQLKAGVNPPRE